MRYYLCILGNFPDVDDIYNDCIQRGIYQYHESTRQKGVADSVEEDSTLILVYRKELRAYATVGNKTVQGLYDGWITISTKTGWQGGLEKCGPRVPWGVYLHTLEGNKQSIVKEMDSSWATELILMIKRAGENGFDDISFPVHVEELAVGVSGDNYFTIPAVQRGLVWDSVRCEVLWDSILRGIPIGAISVRRNGENQWEIFDGQQRSNAIALGYSDYNNAGNPESVQRILWIDLDPHTAELSSDADDENARKYCFRLTTAAHPWGYAISKNETKTTYLPVREQKAAVDKLNGNWCLKDRKGARPYPVELWPFDSQLPVPFGVLRGFVERAREAVPPFEEFVNTCKSQCRGMNWVTKLDEWMAAHDKVAPSKWDEICRAVHTIERYTIVALNCKDVDEQDIGLYFKRMNKQGIVPDTEELNYSLIKSKIPEVKCLDDYGCRRTPPARLAHVAMRFWGARQDKWKEIKGVDVQDILRDKEAFERFVRLGVRGENGFEELMYRLEEKLTAGENGLMPLHVQFIYNAGDGELAVLLLRYCQENAGMDSGVLRAIATTVAWFSQDIPAAVRAFWKSSSPQEGVMRAFTDNRLVRLPSPDELDIFLKECNYILNRDNESDWTDVYTRIKESPYVADAIGAVWNGFHNGKGCPLLLYGCRRFIQEWFADYDPCSLEWGEQNRPWDYDHIAPQDWFGGNQMKQDWRLPLCRQARDSIGNSAPLPFSLNRARQDAPPGMYYPTGCPDDKSTEFLHIDEDAVRRYSGQYGRMHRNGEMAVLFVCTTFNRISALYRNWYEGCEIAILLDYSKIKDDRRVKIESVRKKLDEFLTGVECYFLRGQYQHIIRNDWDWTQKWISCGAVGMVTVDGTKVKCLLGIAVGQEGDEVVWEWGARRHPAEVETNTPNGWWVASEDDQYIYNSCNGSLDEEICLQNLKQWMSQYCFEAL